tara:strand:- start:568 stop:1041 length:474 start_codon:yes stop_codon:yes gene_type:complete
VLFGSCSFNTNNEILKKNNSIPIVDFDSFYSILDLSSKKTYVVNFWATWCAPCIKELPYFEYINDKYESDSVKVILVSLDFPSQIESKLKPYLKSNNIKSSVILLDDSELNTWVPKVSNKWDGAIPATLILNRSNYNFYSKPFEKDELIAELNKVLY